MARRENTSASIALDMLSGRPWEQACGAEARLRPDVIGSLADALAGLACRVPTKQWSTWLARSLDVGASVGLGSRPGFLESVAYHWREALQDGRSGVGGSVEEIAFCASPPAQCEELDALRSMRGLAFSQRRAESSGRALLAALGQELRDAGAPPESWASSVCDAVSCVGGQPALAPRAFLLVQEAARLGAQLPDDSWGRRFYRWDSDPAGSETRYSWRVVAEEARALGQESGGHPWGLWLALALPERLAEWGEALGLKSADWARQAELARALSVWSKDEEGWGCDCRAGCVAAAARLEGMALGAGVASAPKARPRHL